MLQELKLKLLRMRISPFAKPFVPIELIAKNPVYYGYPKIEKRHSNAKQEKYLNDTNKIVASVCANRSGKTEVGAAKFIMTAKQYKDERSWVLTPSFDAQKGGAQEKIMMYLKESDFARKPDGTKDIEKAFGSAYKQIRLSNGHIIEFKTYEQGREKLQSAKLRQAWFDEEPPEPIYTEVYTRTVDLKGQILLTFTPLKGFTWSYNKIYNSKRKDVSVYQWGMADNPFIPLSEIALMKSDLSIKEAKMRLFGEYQGSETQIYYMFHRTEHVKPNLFNKDFPVDVVIDWGVVTSAVLFFQQRKVETKKKKMHIEHYLVDAFELENMGYGGIMRTIFNKGYFIDNWYCDPAGRQRSQATRSGVSVLNKIENEYGVKFKYIKRLSIEESIELVSSYMKNANNDIRFYVNEGIKLNKKEHTPEQRIENYVRDEETHKPIDDDFVTHFNDCLRYYFANKIRKRGIFRQH